MTQSITGPFSTLPSPWEARDLVNLLHGNFEGAFTDKYGLSRQHFIHHGANRININLRRKWKGLNLLEVPCIRETLQQCRSAWVAFSSFTSLNFAIPKSRTLIKSACKPTFGYENIIRLQIAVDNAVTMGFRQSVRICPPIFTTRSGSMAPAHLSYRQGITLQELHHEEEMTVCTLPKSNIRIVFG